MVKRSTPAKVLDERTFAVRVRFAIPERGLKCLPDMHNWLRDNAANDYAIHSATAPGWDPQQCGLLYVNSLPIAMECAGKFELNIFGTPKQTP